MPTGLPPPEWHAEARALYTRGVRVPEIAKRFGKSYDAAAFAVDHNNYRRRHAERCAKARKIEKEIGT